MSVWRASRQHAGSRTRTVLSPTYETREIWIAYGIQFHPDQLTPDFKVDAHLDSVVPEYPRVEKVSDTEYRNHDQRVIYRLRETVDKEEFRNWLMTPGVMVVYNGHARHGRGPCFGRLVEGVPNEEWGEGTDRFSTGQFRIGFPFIGIDGGEIVEHGYTAHILKEGDELPAAEDCHPELRPHLDSLVARTPDQIHANLAARLRGHAPGDRYWTYRKVRGGPVFVVHRAGWQETASAPNDWGSTLVRCRAFCHFGCSTFRHNYPVVRQLAEWRREGNERYAFWTTELAYAVTTSRWVANVICYGEENAFASWEGVLRYAVERTNRDLRNEGYGYRVR